MKLLTHHQRIRSESFGMVYAYIDHPDAGFSFPCDKDGSVGFDKKFHKTLV